MLKWNKRAKNKRKKRITSDISKWPSSSLPFDWCTSLLRLLFFNLSRCHRKMQHKPEAEMSMGWRPSCGRRTLMRSSMRYIYMKALSWLHILRHRGGNCSWGLRHMWRFLAPIPSINFFYFLVLLFFLFCQGRHFIRRTMRCTFSHPPTSAFCYAICIGAVSYALWIKLATAFIICILSAKLHVQYTYL